MAYGLTLYNVLAACLILWTATELGGAALWGTGSVHAAIGALWCSRCYSDGGRKGRGYSAFDSHLFVASDHLQPSDDVSQIALASCTTQTSRLGSGPG